MADYTAKLGRLQIVAVNAPLDEQLGDGFDAVGPVLTPAEAKPRDAKLSLPIHGPSHRRSNSADGQRIRRQVRALLENPILRSHGLYLYVSWDPEYCGWLMVGSGALSDSDGMGPTFADWTLDLSDTYRVGTTRTVRPGRRVEVYDRRTGTAPRDTLRRVYSTDFAAMSTFSVVGLQPTATDPTGTKGRVLGPGGTQSFAFRDGSCPVTCDATHAEVLSYKVTDPSAGLGDAVAVDRRGKLLLIDAGHSYVAGYGLTPTAARYPQVMTWEGVRSNNLTTAISGAILAAAAGAGYSWYLQTVARGNSITAGNILAPTNCYLHGWGQNDLPQYGSGNLEPIMEAFRRVLARSLSAASYEDNDAAWTHSGGTARTATDKNSGAGWRQAATNGDKSTITIPADYNGDRIAVGFVVNGAATGTAEARVNGTLVASWPLGGTQQASSSGWNGVVRYLPGGIKPGDSLEVRWASLAGTAGSYPGLDCVEFEASAIPATWVLNHNRLISYSAYSGQPFPPDDNAVNAFNARLKTLIESEYPWPVAYVDADAALNKNAALFQGDNVHPNELGHQTIARYALGVMNPAEEMPGPDWPILYPAGDPPALDNGRVIVNYAGSGIFRVIAWDPTVNPSGGGWVEQGKFCVERIGNSTGVCSTLVTSKLLESSTERVVSEMVLRNGSDSNSRERVLLTLERGWTGPRVEVYPAPKADGSAADAAIRYSTTEADTYNELVKLDAGGAVVNDCGAGSTFSDGQALGASTFTGENWVYLARTGKTFSVCFGVSQVSVAATSKRDSLMYGANRNGLRLASSGGQQYVSALIGYARNYAQLDAEAESWTLDATATAQSDAAASPGSGNSRVQSTRTADGQTVRQAAASTPGASKWRALTRAKVDSPATGSIKHAYLFATALGTTTSTSYTWVDSGTLDGGGLANQPAAVNCWRSSGASGNVYIDRILWVPLESRYTGGDFVGARDIGAMVLADTRSVPVLVAL